MRAGPSTLLNEGIGDTIRVSLTPRPGGDRRRASHHRAVISRDHIVQALAPLYRGKTHTFLAENRDASGGEVKNRIEALCQRFEQLKPYLLESWNGGK